MIRRFIAAAFATVLSFGPPGLAVGQTVADYREAVAEAPILDAPRDTAEAYCRPLTNFVFTSIPPWELKRGWILAVLPFDPAVDETIAAKRARCLEFRDQPVISFDGGTGEEIVDPPSLEDPDRVYRTEPSALPPLAPL